MCSRSTTWTATPFDDDEPVLPSMPEIQKFPTLFDTVSHGTGQPSDGSSGDLPLSERHDDGIIRAIDIAAVEDAIRNRDRDRIGDILAEAGIVGNGSRRYAQFIDCLFWGDVDGVDKGSVGEMIRLSFGERNFHALRRMDDDVFEDRTWRKIAEKEVQDGELMNRDLAKFNVVNRSAFDDD